MPDVTPYTLHPTPYTLHPTPYTLHPTPYTLDDQCTGVHTRDSSQVDTLLSRYKLGNFGAVIDSGLVGWHESRSCEVGDRWDYRSFSPKKAAVVSMFFLIRCV